MEINATSIVPTEVPVTIRREYVLATLDLKEKIVEAMHEFVLFCIVQHLTFSAWVS